MLPYTDINNDLWLSICVFVLIFHLLFSCIFTFSSYKRILKIAPQNGEPTFLFSMAAVHHCAVPWWWRCQLVPSLCYKYSLVCVLLCPWNGFLEVELPEPRASGFTVRFRGCSWGALLFASLGAARRRLVLTVSSPEVSIELLDYCQSDRWGRVPRCTVTAYFSSCGCVQVTLTCLTLFSFSFVSPVCSCLWLYFTRL